MKRFTNYFLCAVVRKEIVGSALYTVMVHTNHVEQISAIQTVKSRAKVIICKVEKKSLFGKQIREKRD